MRHHWLKLQRVTIVTCRIQRSVYASQWPEIYIKGYPLSIPHAFLYQSHAFCTRFSLIFGLRGWDLCWIALDYVLAVYSKCIFCLSKDVWFVWWKLHSVWTNGSRVMAKRILRKVLVKCRQNVANKLFITRVFNPVHPHTWLTALSALQMLSYVQQRLRQALSLCEVQNLHTIRL